MENPDLMQAVSSSEQRFELSYLEEHKYPIIEQAIRAWQHSRKLESKIRWNHRRPDTLSIEDWADPLGPDANNMEHLFVTAQIAKFFIEQGYSDGTDINDELGKTVILVAYVHDLQEYLDKNSDGKGGDIASMLKNHEDEFQEIIELEYILRQDFTDVINDKERESIIGCLRDRHSENGSQTEAGLIFDLVEKCGYLKTGQIAQRNLDYDLARPEATRPYQRISSFSVFKNIPLLFEQIHYKAVEMFLLQHSDSIDKAFDWGLTKEGMELFKLELLEEAIKKTPNLSVHEFETKYLNTFFDVRLLFDKWNEFIHSTQDS
jgi:5'-deoxynucleotidase YfbR-like HD superfamily hydrolase